MAANEVLHALRLLRHVLSVRAAGLPALPLPELGVLAWGRALYHVPVELSEKSEAENMWGFPFRGRGVGGTPSLYSCLEA